MRLVYKRERERGGGGGGSSVYCCCSCFVVVFIFSVLFLIFFPFLALRHKQKKGRQNGRKKVKTVMTNAGERRDHTNSGSIVVFSKRNRLTVRCRQ